MTGWCMVCYDVPRLRWSVDDALVGAHHRGDVTNIIHRLKVVVDDKCTSEHFHRKPLTRDTQSFLLEDIQIIDGAICVGQASDPRLQHRGFDRVMIRAESESQHGPHTYGPAPLFTHPIFLSASSVKHT